MISPIVCPIESQMAGSGPNRVEIANTANNPGPGEMAYTKVAITRESKVSKSIARL